MSPRKCFVIFAALALVATGCQQKKAHRVSLREGRGLRGGVGQSPTGGGAGGTSTGNQCGTYKVPGKSWGGVYSQQGDQAFYNEIYYLMYPVLSQLPDEDQLGYVSSRLNDSTGVRFWGNAEAASGNVGALNGSTARIRIEIYDDRACMTKADGSVRSMFPIDIAASQEDFVSATGSITTYGANLTFTDSYGSIIMSGTFSGSDFVGTMSYTVNGFAGMRKLGQFTVPRCQFFVCK
jgi:hypothetical protein